MASSHRGALSALRGERTLLRGLQAITSIALVAGCGASYSPDGDAAGSGEVSMSDDVATSDDVSTSDEPSSSDELGSLEQGLSAACGGEDSNALSAALAVAIGNELGRWDVNTDFQIVNGKLELSTTGKLHCGTGCSNITALLRLQDDVSSVIRNHVPATYRSKLTSWYGKQATTLTNLVNEMLNVDEGVFRIRSKLSGKYIVPQNGSTTSGAVLEQSDQYSSTTAAQWRVLLKGTKRQLINQKSGMCMDLSSNTSSSTSIVQRPCSGVSTQNFRLGQLEAGVLTIRSDYNQAFIPQSSSTANGADIVQSTVTGATQEKFIFEPSGSGAHSDLLETATAVYSLKVAHTGMGIAVSSSSVNDGVTVVQQPYVATDDRFHWYVTQLGTATINGVAQTTYQFMNRRTGKCLDLDGSSPRRLVQRTCSTSYTQRFALAPTGNLRQVAYTYNGLTVDVQNGSTASGALVVEGRANEGWQYYNMITFDPILAIEPHKLRFNRTEAGGPCGNYYWYDVTAPNGISLDDPASTYVQLIFAGGKQTATGTDVNPFIAQKVSGNQVAIDPTYGLNDSRTTSTGACTASCIKVSTASVAGQCCSCNSVNSKFVKASWSAVTYMCQ
jgi:ricin-type beta-trefoil lectin protein